jgi:FtsP/CotA-like multicopper oxidase with cupredoxin domain
MKLLLSTMTLLLAASTMGCGAGYDQASADLEEADPWLLTMASATDLDASPDIVEVNIEARPTQVELRPGVWVESWTYNGSVPGPMIEANVGDRLVVHFTNQLPEETTIHWHGVELPAEMDGTPLSQKPVQPGGTFTYSFDLLTAATYWYHPHVRGNEQVERGLYGALVVRDPNESAELALPSDDVVLLVDDVLLDDQQKIAAPFPSDPLARAEMQVNGREGNVLLANGRELPTLHVAADEQLRLRVVNVANARFFRLSLDGHDMVRIGGDGGLASASIAVPAAEAMAGMDGEDHDGMPMGDMPMGDMPMGDMQMGGMAMAPKGGLMLVPGERADVLITPRGEPGDELVLKWHDAPRGQHTAVANDDGSIGFAHAHDDGKRMPRALLRLIVGKPSKSTSPITEAGWLLRDIVAIDADGAAPLPVTFGHGMPNADGDVMFFATMKDGMGIPFAKLTAEDALHATIGETRVWEVVNMTGGDHPFHPHGFFFQHLETELVDMDNPDNNRVMKPEVLENKDTILVPRRPGSKGRSKTIVRLAVHFDSTNRINLEAFGKSREGGSGGWMAHCHILEHADRGMMTFFNLTAPEQSED